MKEIYKDITGQKSGRLTAIKRVGSNKNGNSIWLCECDCGNKTKVRLPDLTSNRTKSCGCLQKEKASKISKIHGLSINKSGDRPRLYRIWLNMKQRCNNQNASKYKNYGGRGISVCNEWKDYINFHNWSKNNGYKDSLTLDRINNNGDYCPDNCRWVTYREQNLNSSQNHLITYNGQTMTITEWAEYLNIKRATLYSRILEYGWPVEKAINTSTRKWEKPIIKYNGQKKHLKEWAKDLGIKHSILYKRIITRDWDIERAFNQPVKEA